MTNPILSYEVPPDHNPLDDCPQKVREIIRAVCAEHRISWAEFYGEGRRRHVVTARWDAVAQLRAMPWRAGHPSLPQIGRWMGRDHTSALHALRRLAQQ